jgi:outer membrane protein assembly factor BamD
MELLKNFHMKKRNLLKGVISVSIALSLLFGCGGKGKDVKKIEGDPEIFYKQGLARFNKRDYSEALKKFEELKSSFPDSPPFTTWAELKVGDCHFLKKEYVEAIAAYEEFRKIHPGHEEIPYVQYQIGMCYYNQMLAIDRDQTPAKKAISSFEYLIANAPPSLFTVKAKEKIGVCKKRMIDHEFYIGSFYYKKGRYEAAALRFEGLLKEFPKGPEEDKTLYFLGKSYLELDEWEKAEVVFMKIVTEYPKSLHYKEARTILDKGLTETKVSHHKKNTKEPEGNGESAEKEPEKVFLVKFEEEGKQTVSLMEEKKVELKKEREGIGIEQMEENRISPIPPSTGPKKVEPALLAEPMKEDQPQALSPLPSEKTTPRIEVIPDEEKRVAPLPNTPSLSREDDKVKKAALLNLPLPFKEEEKVKKKVLPDIEESKLRGTQDEGQPIDIVSDQVEAFWKENLILFKGNVIARQNDIVIYADSLEAVIIEDGKGIDRVIAGGNVKIQQGLRVANCQKAIFYNLDQKFILTGDPKVSEGDNIVSGDEIVFDIEKNQVEVKGGPSGRGKAKIQPGGEIEKLK